MKAAVLAAGYGQRLRPITEKFPKAMVPVGGRPMIEYSLLLLKHYGIREIMINLHYLGEIIEEHLKDGSKLGLKITYSREEELLDTGGALLHTRPFLEKETFVVINSDVIIDLSLSDLLEAHKKRHATATLVLRPDPEADRYGPIEVGRNLRIERFLGYEAPGRSRAPLSKLMFTGVQVLEPRVFAFLEAESSLSSRRFSITQAIYPKMLAQGEPLYGYRFDGFWQDLGTAERIKEAESRLQRGQARLHYL
ncbi:MAG: NDP-sugar synthase [Deltaproteobacteria bacterium]|nr:NDP-sugar synthase [Deltaproteobacteria bacterium]